MSNRKKYFAYINKFNKDCDLYEHCHNKYSFGCENCDKETYDFEKEMKELHERLGID